MEGRLVTVKAVELRSLGQLTHVGAWYTQRDSIGAGPYSTDREHSVVSQFPFSGAAHRCGVLVNATHCGLAAAASRDLHLVTLFTILYILIIIFITIIFMID
jgi:hypothetical protein